MRAIEESLERLATDYVDIYYIHRDPGNVPMEETVAAMADLIRAGKVRYWGVSNLRGWRIAEAVRACDALGAPRPIVSPAVLQPDEPPARERHPARVRSLRHRRGALLAARARRARRQVQAG